MEKQLQLPVMNTAEVPCLSVAGAEALVAVLRDSLIESLKEENDE